ncbi:MAG TPA: alanine racemase [Caulobacterales bacterium]|nr:alanine racemase [Caulobacterales bacterium]
MVPEAPRRLARLTVCPQAAGANWKFFAARSAGETGAVVKADGYGLGADLIAPALAAAGARTFFVATLGEGLSLRSLLGETPAIYVFNGPAPGESAAYAQAALIPVLNSPAQIALWDGAMAHALHIDTGMNRLGLKPNELSAANGLKPLMVMSHLACASDPAHPKNAAQRARFTEIAARFPDARKSLAASGGVLLGRDYTFDLTRPGIGLYGGGALDEANPPLSVVATLEAPILQVFDLPIGETVGYGATFTAAAPIRAATVALGYADGWLRSLSGKGYGHIGGALCPLLGRVSMDLVTIDISAAPNAREGDLVEFLGANAKLDDVAVRAGTISYEVLTNLSGVRRQT